MKHLVVLFLFLVPSGLSGQNSAERLSQSRQKTLQEIEYANKLLQETKGKTKQSLTEINLINHKLRKRREYLIGLEVEVSAINESIEINTREIIEIQKEISRIKTIYARMITNLYKNKIPNYMAMYIVASENMNQLYKRIHTVKQYNNYLRIERAKLDTLQKGLENKNAELGQLRASKGTIVDKTRNETIIIQREMNEKNKMVKQLKQRQKEIEDDIKNKQRTAKKLEDELRKIIEEERKKSRAKTGTRESMTPADKIISSDFEKNTGKLPWPTQKGIITGKYGEHQHPDYKNVTVKNDGIYIATTAGENVRAIFKGVVSRVFQIQGQNYSVIIKHGQYFSLYHNLINVKVKPGQSVETKEVIGTVSTDSGSKETILHFQIWKETERSDPEIWLAPI